MKGVLKKASKGLVGKTVDYYICVCFCSKIAVDAMLNIPEALEDKYDAYEDFFEDCFEELSKVYGKNLSIQEMVSNCSFPSSLSDFEMNKLEVMDFLNKEIIQARKDNNLRKELGLIELFKEGLCDKKKEPQQDQQPQ